MLSFAKGDEKNGWTHKWYNAHTHNTHNWWGTPCIHSTHKVHDEDEQEEEEEKKYTHQRRNGYAL